MSLTCISYKSPDVIAIAKSLGLPAQVIAAEISVMMGKQESKNVPNEVRDSIASKSQEFKDTEFPNTEQVFQYCCVQFVG